MNEVLRVIRVEIQINHPDGEQVIVSRELQNPTAHELAEAIDRVAAAVKVANEPPEPLPF